ncbi:hypothetical protein [Pseudoduganella albidiflava]|uniref:Uncharacterized protein n=1 Tax=Pseudoduganella albidiflava TaxID=321983 RepID=A0A411WVC6_9BURK|nr:hypothetical protein [Pseudoduganella albidiflava]QBI00715.1 hypothetical protein EYF70_07500 [Pseudoduganella albidiflava]GGY31170.1 hypothetical protein GCM10007387_11460 [Pseudoduganella albidiflava]
MKTELPDNETRVIEGIVTDLLVASEWDDLLDKISKHCRVGTAVAGGDAMQAGSYGRIPPSPGIMGCGEYDDYFVCLVGQQVLWGGISGANKLPVGKKIKAVVEQHGDVLVARGMISEDTGLAWLRHVRGGTAERRNNFKVAWWWFCCAMVFEIPFVLLQDVDFGIGKLRVLGWGTLATGAPCLWFAIWDSINLNGVADETTEILRQLGFADPEHVNLGGYLYKYRNFHEVMHGVEQFCNLNDVHCYQQAVKDGKLKLADPAER